MIFKILLLSLSFLFSFSAFGQTYNCERTQLDTLGFSNKSVAESWYNKNITISTDLNQKTAALNMRFSSDLWIRDDKKKMKGVFYIPTRDGSRLSYTITFLANGEVHANLTSPGGYENVGGAIYRCSGWNGSL